MRELNMLEVEEVNGGVPVMLVFWASYTIMMPVFAAGVAAGATETR